MVTVRAVKSFRTLSFLFLLLYSSLVSAQNPRDGSCPNDVGRNWISSRLFDGNGNVISENRTYSDYLGRPTQTQARLFSEQNVIATQTVYDAFGRSVMQTLSAPANQRELCYKSDFITNASGSDYSYSDFDIPNNFANPSLIGQGEVDNPKPVASGLPGINPGTLGWYYSNNNSIEPFVPASGFPYSRTEFDDNNGGVVKRTSLAGEVLKMGGGHESHTYTMPASGELRYVYGIVNGWEIEEVFEIDNYPDFAEGHVISNFQPEIKAVKTIAVDQNGIETVVFYDADGNLLATCLSGQENGENVRVLHVMSIIKPGIAEQQYTDIHLPQGCEGSLTLPNSGNTSPATPIPTITYHIFDLKKGKYIDFGGTPDFTGTNPGLPPGFYRIIYKQGATLSELQVKYDVNYYGFSINYFDKAGRLKMSIPPAGIDLSYNPNKLTTHLSASKNIRYVPGPSAGNPDWSLDATSPDHVLSAVIIPAVSPEVQITNLQVALSRNPVISHTFAVAGPRILVQDHWPATLFNQPLDVGDPVGGGNSPPDPPIGGAVYSTIYTLKFDVVDQNNDVIAQNKVLKAFRTITTTGLAGQPSHESWTFSSPETAIVPPLASNTTSRIDVVVTSLTAQAVAQGAINIPLHPVSLDNALNALKLSLFSSTERLPGIPVHAMPEVYDYNSLGWLLSFTSPDEGKTEFVYKKDGSLRFKQNAVQRSGNRNKLMQKFSYVNYDAFNRVVETGEYDPSLAGTPPNSEGVAISDLYFENYYDFSKNIAGPPSASKSIHRVVDNRWAVDPARCTHQNYLAYDLADPDFYAKTGLPASVYQPSFTWGKVAKTWNREQTTWYSYNELGQLAWMVQRIENMPNGHLNYSVKTLHYKYDFNGNVLEVNYQKEVLAENFVHYYTYDADKRLQKVETRQGGHPKEEQAAYFYYQHGPLKRVELADKLQGVDYVYTINGWLKSINAPELNERDPGQDGAVNSSHPTPKDLFGMTLDYFPGDYSRPGSYIQTYDIPDDPSLPLPLPSPVEGNPKNLYNGLAKGQRWQTQKPAAGSGLTFVGNPLMYGYQYDKKYQLTDATFGAITFEGAQNQPGLPPGSAEPFGYYGPLFAATEEYNVSGIRYDLNGNIESLNRNAYVHSPGTAGLDLDRLTYNYAPHSNQLLSVSDAVPANHYAALDFKSGQGPYNYIYNEIGQLTADVNEGNYYEYDPAGNVTAVYSDAGQSVIKARFLYNDKGARLKKTNAAGDETWYIRDADGNVLSIYEKPAGGPIRQAEVGIFAASRIGVYDVQANQASYELNDHLGNVRTTFSKQAYYTPSTSFEGDGEDDHLFNFQPGLDHTQARTGGSSVKVVFPAQQYGAGIRIKVTTGQKISASIYSKYLSGGAPNAMLVFSLDNASGNLDWRSQRVGGAASTWNLLAFPAYTVAVNAADMWLSIYPWNPDAGSIPVWFDDLSVAITPNSQGEGGYLKPVQQSLTDYYPHGGLIPGREYVAGSHYRYGYQGQYSEKDPETGFNSFELRMWDGRLGRWMSPDPYRQYFSPYLGMGNNPVSNIDPSGGYNPDWFIPEGGSPSQAKWIDNAGPEQTPAGMEWLGAFGYTFGPMNLNAVEVSSYRFTTLSFSTVQNVAKDNTFVSGSLRPNSCNCPNYYEEKLSGLTIFNADWWYYTAEKFDYDYYGKQPPAAVKFIAGMNPLVSGYNVGNGLLGNGENIFGEPQSGIGIALNAVNTVMPFTGGVITTQEGFLLGGVKIKAPFDIPVQRFGGVEGYKPWGIYVGSNKIIARNFFAIKPGWNDLSIYTTGYIPKGTPIKFGVVGPQLGGRFGVYPGGLLQFNADSKYVLGRSTRLGL